MSSPSKTTLPTPRWVLKASRGPGTRYLPGWPLLTVLARLVLLGMLIQFFAEDLIEVLPAAGRAFANLLVLPLVLLGVVSVCPGSYFGAAIRRGSSSWLLLRSSRFR